MSRAIILVLDSLDNIAHTLKYVTAALHNGSELWAIKF